MNNAASALSRYSRKRAIISIVCCAAMAALVFYGVMTHIFVAGNDSFSNHGINSFRMFTVLSNILVAVCAVLSIPYQIDGVRTGNYHMPRWIVYTLYTGVTAVTMTLMISACVLAPFAGFTTIMFGPSGLFLHTICPVISVLMFIFVNADHKIPKKMILVAIAPIFVYAAIYIFMAFVLGPENGGWNDHYSFNTYLPWPVTAVVLLSVSAGIAAVIRLAHNAMHKRRKAQNEKMYKDFLASCGTIEEAVEALAVELKALDNGKNDVNVPRRAIKILESRYNSGKSEKELCNMYIDKFFELK